MTAQDLDLFISNDSLTHNSIRLSVKNIRHVVAAAKLAKANAEWHDDLAAEDHAEFHAPASEQFTREVRDEVIRDLVAYWLSEANIQEEAAK